MILLSLGVYLKAWPESVEALKNGGITSVTLANNHIADYRTESALLTKQVLMEHSIDFAGLTQGTGPHYSLQVIYEYLSKDLINLTNNKYLKAEQNF